MAKKSTTGKDTPVRAMIDVMGATRNSAGKLLDRIPRERFGPGKGRILRKMVLLAIAASADPDGTNAYPSIEVIARRCLVSERAARKVIAELIGLGVLEKQTKAGRSSKRGRTNLYTIVFSTEHLAIEVPDVHPEIEVPHVSGTPGNRSSRCTPGTTEQTPGNRSSYDRPIDRPGGGEPAEEPGAPRPVCEDQRRGEESTTPLPPSSRRGNSSPLKNRGLEDAQGNTVGMEKNHPVGVAPAEDVKTDQPPKFPSTRTEDLGDHRRRRCAEAEAREAHEQFDGFCAQVERSAFLHPEEEAVLAERCWGDRDFEN